MSIADLRREYTKASLDEAQVDRDPMVQLEIWLSQAIASRAAEPNAMILATADAQARPSARVVLLKGLGERGIEFYTDYSSRKGRELNANRQAAAVFFWPELERQVRLTGHVEKMTREESVAYFQSRPRASQIAAFASRQSSRLADRSQLEEAFARAQETCGDGPVPTPERWGGYRLVPDSVEFWQGRRSRLHDRIEFRKSEDGAWRIGRLSP